jgi:hypothetical protein
MSSLVRGDILAASLEGMLCPKPAGLPPFHSLNYSWAPRASQPAAGAAELRLRQRTEQETMRKQQAGFRALASIFVYVG